MTENKNRNIIIAQFTNHDDAMTAFVVESFLGGYGVSLRDDDSGEFVGFAIHGIKSLGTAIAKAKEVL